MNEVGGSESGTGLRAIKSSRSSDANFEYDDSEWDVGIGNLIIDLDADIEKTNEASRNNNNSSSVPATTPPTTTTGSLSATASGGGDSSTGNTSNLSVTSPGGGGGGSSPQMHIPLTSSSGSNSGNSKTAKSSSSASSSSTSTSKGSNSGTGTSDTTTVMEHSSILDKGLKMKIKRTKTGTKSAEAKHEIVKSDVVGSSSSSTSSNGTGTSSSSGNNSAGYTSSNNKSSSVAEPTPAKNSHASHKDKDKLLVKDCHLHDSAHEGVVGAGGNTPNSKMKGDTTPPTDHSTTTAGGKVKTPRKGSTKEKKVKNSNVGNSGNSKKEEKSGGEGAGKNSISNSGSAPASTGSHAKDNKEFFTTTVNLNVPNVIPNSSSSAFVKTTGTIKVPTAPSSTALSLLTSSASSSTAGNSGGVHNLHSSGNSGGDSLSSSSNSRNSSSSNSNSSSVSSGNSPWVAASPSKGGDKGRLSPSVNLNSAAEKTTGNSYKKARAFAVAAAAAATSASDKTGSNQDENSSGSHGSSSSSSSYRNNQGALSINSATDLSSSSAGFVPGSQSENGSSFGSPKETGKGARNAATTAAPITQDVCVGTSVGTVTEPDCLGPCEPGTSVTLEGIVWHETESGVLVVNVTWRGKTYVGTLIDCTKNDWAPPRFCDSPTSDLEMRTPKNRGKRGRAQAATPVNEPPVADTRSANAKLRNGAKGRRGSNTAAAFVAPASPVKPDSWPKRKTRGSENESQEESNPKSAKRPKVYKDSDRKDRRSNSPAENEKSGPSSPQLIECPEPNCSKKYKHINGLRYHQSHAHTNNFVTAEDSDSNMSTASNTNASAPADQPGSNSADNTVEPMVVDGEIPDGCTGNTSAPGSVTDDSVSAPSTPVKKGSGTSSSAAASGSKVDDKIYDLSSDADLNPGTDSSSPGQDGPEPYSSKSGKSGAKSQSHSKDSGSSDESKLSPENLSKDSPSTTPPATANSTSTTPTLTPRTPILTVPVVPYMSLERRNMVHGHVVNVPRVENSHNSRDSENSSPMKNSGNQSASSKSAPWQPHAQSSHGSSHVMNGSSSATSITVPLNIPMNIPEKIGGGSIKDRERSNSSDQPPSKKNKHKKKSKDEDKERDGKSKDKDKGDMSKGLNVPKPSDYSRSSVLFHNSGAGSDSMRSKDTGSGDDNDSSRKNSIDNRDDPQSPAYSDISDANDSGPDAELNVSGAIKETNCKGLVIPTAEIKKDPMSVQGVPGGPPFQSFFNHNLHSPYLDSLSYAAQRQAKESPEGRGPPAGPSPDEAEKPRPPSGQLKHPGLPPSNAQPPPTAPTPGGGNEDGRRSPKMDFHPKYPYPNPHFSYPYSSFHPYSDHPSFPAPYAIPPENSFNSPGHGRMFPGMEEKDNGGGGSSSGKGSSKSGEKDEGPAAVQIKQEPVDREERRGKEKPQTSAFAMNIDQDKSIDIKSEFGSDHTEPKQVPPYMSNSSSKHHSKEHKRSSEDSRHERRHEGKDMESKSENMKSGRNSSSEKSKGSSSEDPPERPEPKERKDEGVKATMETTGPPPPPTASAYYLPQGFLPGNPFGLPFDPGHPLYRQMMVPGHYPGSPYMHPGQIPRFSSPGGPTPLPEDLSRPAPGGPPGNPSKALDLLQHHAAQYYNSHKIHELQERALKSPSPQVANQRGPVDRDGPGPGGAPPSSSPGHPMGGPGSSHPIGGGRGSMGPGVSANSAMPKPADLSKDSSPL